MTLALKFLVQKYVFYPFKKRAKKHFFWGFLKNTGFSQKRIWLFEYFPWEIPFLEMYTFICITLLVFKLWQKQFSPNATKLHALKETAPILWILFKVTAILVAYKNI